MVYLICQPATYYVGGMDRDDLTRDGTVLGFVLNSAPCEGIKIMQPLIDPLMLWLHLFPWRYFKLCCLGFVKWLMCHIAMLKMQSG